MKIAVLFGSFNPITNAHISAMKNAVKAIGADKGLFVPTNCQYLKRKIVKIDAPFYLPEDERKAIIDKVYENEPNIELACFELGGEILTVNRGNSYVAYYKASEAYKVAIT